MHIRHGVHFSPPVNREVTSADVAYAIERGANPNVANPYFESYFSSLEGAEKANGGPFPGITTPNTYTIVFHLTEPKAQIVVDALVLPLSAPVPEEYAKKLRRQEAERIRQLPGRDRAVHAEGRTAQARCSASAISRASRRRSCATPTGMRAPTSGPPTWTRSTSSIGGDPTVIGRQVLEGSDMVQNDTPAQPIVKLAYEQFRSQLRDLARARATTTSRSTTSRARSPT